MAITTYKYTLTPSNGITVLDLPLGARVISAKNQFDEVQVWAIVNSDFPTEPHEFLCVGTGWELSGDIFDFEPVDTVLTHGGKLVWHVFHRSPNKNQDIFDMARRFRQPIDIEIE